MKEQPAYKKLRTLLIIGIAGIVVGNLLGLYIPIIKRVCTSSFIIVSGGWGFTALAFCYWLVDILGFRKAVLFFAVVGMNPLFIYLFSHAGGKQVLDSFAIPVTSRLFGWISPAAIRTATILVVSGMLWYMCWFLYRKKVFIRI